MLRLAIWLAVSGCYRGAVPARHGPEALLRRQQAVGSELAGCMVSDMTITTTGASVRATLSERWSERVVAVNADQEITIERVDLGTSLAGKASDHAPEVQDLTKHEASPPVVIDSLNRAVDLPMTRTISREKPTKFELPIARVDPWDLEKVPYPERPIAAGDTFDLRSHFVKRAPEMVPVDHWLDVRFTVERVDPGRSIQLSCAGTERATFHYATVRGGSTATIACRLELDLRNGASARWHIEVAAQGELATQGSPTVTARAQGNVEATLEPKGETDASVCVRVAPS